MYAGWLAGGKLQAATLALRSHFWENASGFQPYRTSHNRHPPTVSSSSPQEIAPGTQKDSLLSLVVISCARRGCWETIPTTLSPYTLGVSGEIILKLSQFAGGGWRDGHADGIVRTADNTRIPSGLIWFVQTDTEPDDKTLIEAQIFGIFIKYLGDMNVQFVSFKLFVIFIKSYVFFFQIVIWNVMKLKYWNEKVLFMTILISVILLFSSWLCLLLWAYEVYKIYLAKIYMDLKQASVFAIFLLLHLLLFSCKWCLLILHKALSAS
jgi:hypothetical protein